MMGGQAGRCVRSVDSWVGEAALGERELNVCFFFKFKTRTSFFYFLGGAGADDFARFADCGLVSMRTYDDRLIGIAHILFLLF
jgi:hypothetical protein